MPRIKLYFEIFRDKNIEKKIKNFDIIRLKCRVLFKKEERWSDLYPAIIDTGAHTSVIPFSIWKNIQHIEITNHKIMGLSKKEESSVPVIIGKITCVITDGENQTNELETYAFLALTDNVPIIIGFKDLLSKFSVYFDYKKKEAFMEL